MEYMFTVTRSSHCCGIYELAGLGPNVIESAFLEAVKERAKNMGQPKVLPLLIQFSDKDHVVGQFEEGKGEQLCALLNKEGYKCDRFKLGHNPKSGNNVSLYHWWVHKGRGGVSKVREYNYNEKERSNEKVEPDNGVPRAAQAAGAGPHNGRYLRDRNRFLRLSRRRRAGL